MSTYFIVMSPCLFLLLYTLFVYLHVHYTAQHNTTLHYTARIHLLLMDIPEQTNKQTNRPAPSSVDNVTFDTMDYAEAEACPKEAYVSAPRGGDGRSTERVLHGKGAPQKVRGSFLFHADVRSMLMVLWHSKGTIAWSASAP